MVGLQTAQAWSGEGHKTVGTIAAALIKGTPAEARVTALLGGLSLADAAVWGDCVKGIDPRRNYSYTVTGRYLECGVYEARPDLLAEMADFVRRIDTQCGTAEGNENCHKQAHYVNLPVQRSRYILGFTGTREYDLLGATRTAVKVLQGQPAPAAYNLKSPREALLVLTHFVGDIHQPLHVGSVYLDANGQLVDPEKHGFDASTHTIGANRILKLVTADKPASIAEYAAGFRPPNLHTIWDDSSGPLAPDKVDAAWVASAAAIEPLPGEPQDWPEAMFNGSLDQARAAFEGLEFSPRQGQLWTVRLTEAYEARMLQIKREQLARAGARLAQLLKALFPN
jgi:hypothetical protein